MDAGLANLLQPSQYGLGIEGELGYHCKVMAALQDGGLLVPLGLPQFLVADIGMALGIARNADPSDSVFCEEAGADDRQRILVGTHWLRGVARNDEGMVGSHFALQAGEEAFQFLLRLQPTCRDVRDRQKAQIAPASPLRSAFRAYRRVGM